MAEEKKDVSEKTEASAEEIIDETAENVADDEASGGEKEDKNAAFEQKLKESEDKYLRLYAEFDNYQKRTQKEKDARYADAVIDTVCELLPVMDNLERALQVEAVSDDAKALKEGVELVKKQMCESLSKLKISEIPAVGEEFDPNLHNAVMHIEDEKITENTVCEEFMKGYIYNNERVVRHSMVKVAN